MEMFALDQPSVHQTHAKVTTVATATGGARVALAVTGGQAIAIRSAPIIT
jgi:hypothetical protein